MTIDQRLDRLAGVVESLAASAVRHDDKLDAHYARMAGLDQRLDKLVTVATEQEARMDRFFAGIAAHDEQLGLLIQLADKHKDEMAELRRSMAETDRLFQAYLKRLPPQ